jgi:hypothetical protein
MKDAVRIRQPCFYCSPKSVASTISGGQSLFLFGALKEANIVNTPFFFGELCGNLQRSKGNANGIGRGTIEMPVSTDFILEKF